MEKTRTRRKFPRHPPSFAELVRDHQAYAYYSRAVDMASEGFTAAKETGKLVSEALDEIHLRYPQKRHIWWPHVFPLGGRIYTEGA